MLAKHGLFKVAEGVWQVRDFDVANATPFEDLLALGKAEFEKRVIPFLKLV